MIGALPSVIKFSDDSHGRDLRLEAAYLLTQLCKASKLTLQIFVGCGGCKVLTSFLDVDYINDRSMVWMGLEGVCSIFQLHGITPRLDFCRMFLKCGLVNAVMRVFPSLVEDDHPSTEPYLAQGLFILATFAQAADVVIKRSVGNIAVIRGRC